MSWESVRDIATRLVLAVDRGDRASAHALAADLQSIADDNVRVLYRFNISSDEVMSGRRLSSGMSVLPEVEVPDGSDGSTPEEPASMTVCDDADDVGVLVNVEAVFDEGQEARPFRRHDVFNSEVSIVSGDNEEEESEAPWEALADETVLGAHSVPAQALMAEARKRAREAAVSAASRTCVDDAPVRENEGFLDFLRVLDTEHPPIRR